MAKSALKLNSTQKFIEVIDIYEEIVILSGGNAAILIEVQATNFDLLSKEEQDAKIYSYASLLNSLSFPIQIVIRSKRLDISSYLNLLEQEAQKSTKQSFADRIRAYKSFVAELIKINSVLDKKFYIVIPFYSLESGILGAKQVLDKNTINEFSKTAKSALLSKAETMHSQLTRIGLKAKTLSKEELIKVYYDIFNDISLSHQSQGTEAKLPMVLGKEKA